MNKSKTNQHDKQRYRKIMRMYNRKPRFSLEEIGRQNGGISKQRVWQIVNQYKGK